MGKTMSGRQAKQSQDHTVDEEMIENLDLLENLDVLESESEWDVISESGSLPVEDEGSDE
jgi:hypothetical protein